MELTSSQQRRAVAVAVSVASALLALLTHEPSGLLIAVVTVCVWMGWKAGLAAVGAASLMSAIILLRPEYETEHGLAQFATFVVGALGLWLVVKIYRTVSFYDNVHVGSGTGIADMPGLGWSAYPDGRLRFLNPAALEYVGVTAAEMREIMDVDDFSWWRRFV